MTPKEHLADWLRDAYAMEHQAVEIFENQAKRLDGYPEYQVEARRQVKISHDQADKLKSCLDTLGEDTSAIKTWIAKMVGNIQTFTGMFSSDEVLKNAVFGQAFEHLQIASYRSLVDAARTAGEQEVARVCEDILQQEQQLATWMDEHLPDLTREYLQRDAMGGKAKH